MKLRLLTLLLFCLGSLGIGVSQAEMIRSNSFELGVFGGKGFYDGYGPLRIKGPWIFLGARVGYFPIKRVSLEASYQYGFSGTQPFTPPLSDANIQSARFNLLYNMWPDSFFVPFITAGAGYERFSVDGGGTSNDLGINGGLGARLFLAKNIAFRFDGRYVTADVSPAGGWQHNFEVTGGLSFFFGGSEPAPEPTPEPVLDTDGDGVTDDADKCPKTASGEKVNSEGCPVDADADGVPDHLDKCKDSPKGAKIDEWGCTKKEPKDSDGDGVMDKADRCPGTAQGTKIDKNGCPLKTKSRGVLKGVTFQSGKNKLTPNSKTILDGVAKELKEFPKVYVEVQGHTDNTGSDELNFSLSRKRAQAVVDYLIARGVDRARLVSKGYGETKPMASNATAEGRAQNRRVELLWLD